MLAMNNNHWILVKVSTVETSVMFTLVPLCEKGLPWFH